MNTNWKNNEQRKEKIAKTLREKAILGVLPWQIAAKAKRERQRAEYEATPKVCKNCGKTYYKAWTKSGKSEFCRKESHFFTIRPKMWHRFIFFPFFRIISCCKYRYF